MADFYTPELAPASSNPFENLAAMNTNQQRKNEASRINALVDALARRELEQKAIDSQRANALEYAKLRDAKLLGVFGNLPENERVRMLPDLAGVGEIFTRPENMNAASALAAASGQAGLEDKQAGTNKNIADALKTLAEAGLVPEQSNFDKGLSEILTGNTKLTPRPGGATSVEAASAKAEADIASKLAVGESEYFDENAGAGTGAFVKRPVDLRNKPQDSGGANTPTSSSSGGEVQTKPVLNEIDEVVAKLPEGAKLVGNPVDTPNGKVYHTNINGKRYRAIWNPQLKDFERYNNGELILKPAN